jgi:hypothetical protein
MILILMIIGMATILLLLLEIPGDGIDGIIGLHGTVVDGIDGTDGTILIAIFTMMDISTMVGEIIFM